MNSLVEHQYLTLEKL